MGSWLAAGYEVQVLDSKSLACTADGSEDWPFVHRQLIRLLDGQVGASELAVELDRVADSFSGRVTDGKDVDFYSDCIPGRFSLELLLLLTHPGSFDGVWKEGGLLDRNWKIFRWPTLVRTGWPVFRLLRLLQKRAQVQAGADAFPHCQDDFASTLSNVRHRQVDQAILGASVSFLSNSSGCQLSAAAACLVGAWVRFPVYDEETEDLLCLAEQLIQNMSLARILVTEHGLLDMLDDVAGSYQAFLIDSGALYVDLRAKEEESEGVIDYTRHMMATNEKTNDEVGECTVEEQTPLGRCNAFAALGTALIPWQKQGVAQEDTIRALRATVRSAEQEHFLPHAMLFRLVEHDATSGELRLLAPEEVIADFQPLVDCLADIFVQVLSAVGVVGLRLEFVVSLWDTPILWRSGTWMSRIGRREDVPPPVFSFCKSDNATWDVPLPDVCQPYRQPCNKANNPRQQKCRLCQYFWMLQLQT